MKNRLAIIVGLFVAFTITSCSLSDLLGDKSLGGGYYLWKEGKDGQSNCILLSTTERYKGTGLIVIPPTVIRTKHNKKVILVLSQNFQSHEKEYWMINKETPIDLDICVDKKSCDSVLKSNVLGPLSYEDFINITMTKGIKLELEG
ncbi:MAG: hypothetical protein AAFN93_21105 [Bacteroidota bacterium]